MRNLFQTSRIKPFVTHGTTVMLFIFFAVFLGHFAVTNNDTWQSLWSGDTKWSVYTSMSIIHEGNTNLDEYLMGRSDGLGGRDYAVEKVAGHYYFAYPIGTPVLSLPIIAVYEKAYSLLGEGDFNASVKDRVPLDVERLCASIIVALTSVLIYQIGNLQLRAKKYSLLLVFIFAFCTSAWSTASRALWQHGPSMLMLTISLYLILLAEKRPRLIQFVAIPLAFSYIVRPTNSISILFITAYVIIFYREYILKFYLWAALVGVPFLIFNFRVYGSLLPGYYTPHWIGDGSLFLEALAGNLISPARGLFIFTPVLLLSILGAFVKFKRKAVHKIDYFLIGIIVAHWLSISSVPHWWGGWSYGPRLFTDMLPFFIYFLIPVFEELPKLKLKLKVASSLLIGLLVIFSFFVHSQGAMEEKVMDWNDDPVSVDKRPDRLWDWGDLQFLRAIRDR
jgi:hypothetical protein